MHDIGRLLMIEEGHQFLKNALIRSYRPCRPQQIIMKMLPVNSQYDVEQNKMLKPLRE
jgi:hypothetical protein